jgi:hypothetical protein
MAQMKSWSVRRVAVVAVLCGTAAFAVCGAARLASFASLGFENTSRPLDEDRRAISVGAEPMALSQATAMREDGVSVGDPDRTEPAIVPVALPVARVAIETALPDASDMLPPKAPPVQMALANTPEQVQKEAKEPGSYTETLDECPVPEICIDQYLWSLYERAPKADARKAVEQIKVTENKNGKTRTITKKTTKYVDEDFTWKDPKAAAKVGMSLQDYVIGGMDRNFKLKLYHALRALDDAGLSPGITSGFRDDYRQSIASGLKASSNSSYHGGSLRGGYGHGLAADVVSVKGETRSERYRATEDLWKWIDAHGKDFGVGRPYLDKDPAHVAPIDGKEYAVKRGGAKPQHAESEAKKSHRVSVRDVPSATARAKLSKVRSSEALPTTRLSERPQPATNPPDVPGTRQH